MASFLRRVDRPGNVKEGIIRSKTFQCRQNEKDLSYTLWKNDAGEAAFALEEYQRDKILPSGDLPGLIEVTTEQFVALELPVPTVEHDDDDPKYGHLHHVTPCLDDASADRLSKVLSPGGVRLTFVRH
jgi:hypothetical protein